MTKLAGIFIVSHHRKHILYCIVNMTVVRYLHRIYSLLESGLCAADEHTRVRQYFSRLNINKSIFQAVLLVLSTLLSIQTFPNSSTSDSLLIVLRNADNDSMRIQALRNIVDFWKPNNSDSTIYYSKKLLQKTRENDDYKYAYKAYYNIVNYYGAAGLYDSALHYSFDGLTYLENADNNFPTTVMLILIGEQYRAMAQFENAMVYLNKAWLEAKKLDRYSLQSGIANRLAAVFHEMKQHEEAILWADTSLLLAKQANNTNYIISNLNIKAAISRDKGDYLEAINNFNEALETVKELDDEFNISTIQNNIAATYFSLKDYTKAIQFAEESYANSTAKNLKALTVVSSELLARTYAEIGKYDKAYQYLRIYEGMRHELFYEERDKQIAELNTQYETKEKEQEIEIQKVNIGKKDLQIRQNNIVIFFFIFVLILLIAFVVYRYLLHRKLKSINEQLSEKNAQINAQKIEIEKSLIEKELLLREVHHRVKNNFQLVSSLLELQSRDIKDTKALESISEGQNRVRAMAMIHQKLYQNDNIAAFDFKTYCMQLVNEIKGIYEGQEVIETKIQIDDVHFDIDTAIPLGLIVNELLTNAFKYAFKPEQTNKLYFSITRQDADSYLLVLRDSGDGLPPDLDISKTKSLGLRLVQRLTKQLHGTFKYTTDGGCNFHITFKDTLQRKETA